MNITILISLSKNRISITRNTLSLIGNPSHILLMVNPEDRTLVVSQGSSSDIRSHKVPVLKANMKREVELYSKPLILRILSIADDWEDNASYRLPGEFIQVENLLRFHIEKSEMYLRGGR